MSKTIEFRWPSNWVVGFLLLCLPNFSLPLVGQLPGGVVIPEKVGVAGAGSPAEKELRLRLRHGAARLAESDHRGAIPHVLAALQFGPATPEALVALLKAVHQDHDCRLLVTYKLALARATEKGHFSFDVNTKELTPPNLIQLREVVRARAGAVAELAAFAQKLKVEGKGSRGNSVLAAWARDFAWELMRSAPGLHRGQAKVFGAIERRHRPDYLTVIKALQLVAAQRVSKKENSAPLTGKNITSSVDLALRAGRCLTGLAAQARFKDLAGPKPSILAKMPQLTNRAQAQRRKSIRLAQAAPLTIAQLTAMTPAERERFSRDHARWSQPGVAISPTGLYIIQTVCGHGTLLGAARTVEMHHARLVNWFGRDPFRGKKGIVRILPEAAGLEAENTPHWWAGGFQAGNLTVLKFAWGSIAGLGRGLTHELTHRFDGAINRGLPVWLLEGRAVWTGASYYRAEDPSFVENFLRPYSMQRPYVRGYGGKGNFVKLIEGTVEDYRDYYSAGYSMFTFLRNWKVGGKQVFRAPLAKYIKNIQASKRDRLAYFCRHFANGKGGRPGDLGQFLKLWQGFLADCYKHCWGKNISWLRSKDFALRLPRTGPARHHGLVKDRPTWSWSRNHAEPWFGDKHAGAAGVVLAAAGQPEAAAAAYLWSLVCDGWRREATVNLGPLLSKLGRKDAAWVVGLAQRRREPGALRPADRPIPLLGRLPRVKNYLRKHRELAQAAMGQGFSFTGTALATEGQRLRQWVGKVMPPPVKRVAKKQDLLPAKAPIVQMGVYGLTETGLTGYEERRQRDLWFVSESGDLHVGRKKPRKKTGVLDRRAHQRHAFVRTITWQSPGAYELRTRVHFTTSAISGAIILGYTRRDRYIRLSFSAGDFRYSIGRKEEPGKTDRVQLSLSGLWQREGHLHGSNPRRRFKFKSSTSFFSLRVRVNGPSLQVFVQDEHIFSYTTPDLSPIEGALGCAMGHGAVRLQSPTICRLDRPLLAGSSPVDRPGLDLNRETKEPLAALLGRSTRGIPRSPNGTIVLLLPHGKADNTLPQFFIRAHRALRALMENPLDHPQHWVLARPLGLDPDADKALTWPGKVKEQISRTTTSHSVRQPFTKRPWLLFVDAHGVLRVARQLNKRWQVPPQITRWARFYRAPVR